MVIIKRKTLFEYKEKFPAAGNAIEEWACKTEEASWGNFVDMKETFNSVDYAGDNRYIFNIKGNQYRLVVMVFFTVRTVYIRWMGTHKDYNKIDCKTI